MSFTENATVFPPDANPKAIQAARDRGEVVVVLSKSPPHWRRPCAECGGSGGAVCPDCGHASWIEESVEGAGAAVDGARTREATRPTTHRTKMDTLPGVEPQLFGAVCFTCGWESESVWTDPEAAEEARMRHEVEARRA